MQNLISETVQGCHICTYTCVSSFSEDKVMFQRNIILTVSSTIWYMDLQNQLLDKQKLHSYQHWVKSPLSL
jgi:hypothetical protein